MKPVLLDTGFIVALLDRSESLHKTCARTIREVQAPLVTCEAVITESCYCVAELVGCVGGGDREHRRWDFPGSFSAFARNCCCQTITAKIQGPED
jgi:hypothetical protein